MGSSPDAYIGYGILLDSSYDVEYPWDKKHDGWEEGNIEEWWCHITGYERSSGLYPFEWIKDHPLPFEEIRIGYSEEPEKLLAVIGTKVWAYDWGTTTFKPEDLTYTKENLMALLTFCSEHGIVTDEIGWHLCTYYG